MSVSPPPPDPPPRLRIGELSRRTGVSADTLRAWERRYGVLRPQRSEGGFRLYGTEDEDRVRAMRALIDSGVSAAEAARLSAPPEFSGGTAPDGGLADHAGRLVMAVERFAEADAHAVLDDALAAFTRETVVEQIVLPVMREIGDRWARGELSVAQEHFGTSVIRGRMLSLTRNWGAGVGPLALLACPPGEDHDIGLVAFGMVLRDRGWRITYLGTDTPIETVGAAAAELGPDVVVLAALSPERFEASAEPIKRLASRRRVVIGGEGATGELADRLGVEVLEDDPVRASIEPARAGRR